MNNPLANWKSTVVGILTGVVVYASSVGAKLPSNAQEWFSFCIGAAAVVLGVTMKDPGKKS